MPITAPITRAEYLHQVTEAIAKLPEEKRLTALLHATMDVGPDACEKIMLSLRATIAVDAAGL